MNKKEFERLGIERGTLIEMHSAGKDDGGRTRCWKTAGYYAELLRGVRGDLPGVQYTHYVRYKTVVGNNPSMDTEYGDSALTCLDFVERIKVHSSPHSFPRKRTK